MVIMSAQKVFDCSDLRKKILSFFPKRCLQCHIKMNNNNPSYPKFYNIPEWQRSENQKMKGYCNWCYFYVFEYE